MLLGLLEEQFVPKCSRKSCIKSVYYITCLVPFSTLLLQILDITLVNGTDGFENPEMGFADGLHSVECHDTLHIMPEVWP